MVYTPFAPAYPIKAEGVIEALFPPSLSALGMQAPPEIADADGSVIRVCG